MLTYVLESTGGITGLKGKFQFSATSTSMKQDEVKRKKGSFQVRAQENSYENTKYISRR